MKNKFSTGYYIVFCLLSTYMANAQMQWNVNLGGGISTSSVLWNESSPFSYDHGPLLQAGSSISSSFGKETLAGWELGINIVRKQYKWTSKSPDEQKGTISDWYLQVPLSLTLDLFEKVGFHLGGRVNWRLTNTDTYGSFVRKWIPAAHVGAYVHINPRIRLDITTYMDILPRNKPLQHPGIFINKARGLGGALNLRYTIH